jgi:hypothetical protein
VFALIATNKNDTLECHAFLCPKKKMVRLVSILCPTSGQILTMTAGLPSCECLDWQYSQFINIVGKDDLNPAAPNFKQG